MNALKTTLVASLGAILLFGMAALLAAQPRAEAPSPSREQIKVAFLAAAAAQPETEVPSAERIKTAFLATAAINECRATAFGQGVTNVAKREAPQKMKARRAVKKSRHRRAHSQRSLTDDQRR